MPPTGSALRWGVIDERPSIGGMVMLLAIVALMLVYLGLAAGLALQYDRQFFMNDAFALVLFGVVLIALLVGERRVRR